MNETEEPLCYLCGSPLKSVFTSADYITGETFSVYCCHACTLGQTLPRLSTTDLSPYYAGVYYKQRKSFTDSHINRVRLRHITRAAKPGRLVDIGCGNGALVGLLHKEGWDAEGTEMAPPEHFVSEEIQKRVRIGEFVHASFPSGIFDVATLWHVFEHLTDPRAYLKELRRTLKPDGLLIIEVPNIDSWQALAGGPHWFNLDVPRHVFHFTPKSLTCLLGEEGFDVVRISHYSAIYSLYGWLQSLLNLFTRRNNILFDLINKKITLRNRAEHGVRLWEIVSTVLLAPFFAVLSVPLTLVESIFKKGGIITVYAKNSSI